MSSRKLKTIAGVIGSPVAQSLSPAIHNAAFASMGKPWRYVAIDVDAEFFAEEVRDARERGLLGLSVTMPHKDAAYAMCSQKDEVAQRSGSVNTLIFNESGAMHGANTDGDGCCDALVHHGVELAGSRVVVLGAGGTARAVVAALDMRGACEIVVVNRTQERAQRAAECAQVARVGVIEDIPQAQIVINTTSVGMGTDESFVPAELLHSSMVVQEAVYHPLKTRLLHDAAAAGARTIDGLWMLIFQAIRQDELWCGVRPDPLGIREVALAELARRTR